MNLDDLKAATTEELTEARDVLTSQQMAEFRAVGVENMDHEKRAQVAARGKLIEAINREALGRTDYAPSDWPTVSPTIERRDNTEAPRVTVVNEPVTDDEVADAARKAEERAGVSLNTPSAERPEARVNQWLPEGRTFSDVTGGKASKRELARYLRSYLLGTNEHLDMDREAWNTPEAQEYKEMRSAADAQSESTNNIGGFLLSPQYSSTILDYVLAESALLRAGTQVVPMASKNYSLPSVLTIPVGGWRAEHAPIVASRATFAQVTFAAKTWAVTVPFSRELLTDSRPSVDDVIVSVVQQAATKAIEDAGLYGAGTDAPLGLSGIAGVVKTDIAGSGGATPTYDKLVDLAGRIQDKGFTPNAFIMSGRSARGLAKLREGAGTGQYLARPPYFDGMQFLSTEFVPNTITGTGPTTNTSDIFCGDWSEGYAMGLNTSLELTRDPYTRMQSTGEYLLTAWLRIDYQPLRGGAPIEMLRNVI